MTPEEMASEWLTKMGLSNSVDQDQRDTLAAFCQHVRKVDASTQSNKGVTGTGAGLRMKYFVLSPESSDELFAHASCNAMLAYAKTIDEAAPQFAKDIREHVASVLLARFGLVT